ncbi:hypothetical protein DFH11DRAFT_1724023 [Phellopilus nigrolimitatus]|nr:hypothetical protein DFH11DRAFT_1730347 [Phellopilus nigrolimitatus]KAH8118044.1 hypothetical protein DFH11DRAFT_1724023 [Phellopilus nigrolimitatus]
MSRHTATTSLHLTHRRRVALVDDVNDLEASETPESILLGAFLWESYHTGSRAFTRILHPYIRQQIAQQAFKFCLKHQRKVEFRRLCETLRQYPRMLLTPRHAPRAASVELELWQEAFRSVEDIHNLLDIVKKSPHPAMMANYYEKLTRVFLTSGNVLFHGAAWARYYSIVRSMNGKSEEELGRLTGQVLISALATPTRTGLLKEALSRNVHKLAPPVVKNLYNILEVTFDPLTLCSSVASLLKELSSDTNYASYHPLLQRALLSRLLAQLAQVYSTMQIAQLLDLVTSLEGSFDGAYGPGQVEAFLMSCARRGDIRVRIDHALGSLTFIDEAFGSTAAGPSTPSALDKSIQPSAGELVRTRLSGFATCLHNALGAIEPSKPAPAAADDSAAQETFAQLVAAANAERKALQVRRAIVARRRELVSELSARKDKEEASRRAEASRREKDEQAKRTLEDIRRKEQDRIRRDIENIKKEEARQLAHSLKEKNILKVDVAEMGDLNTDNLMRLQVQQLEKEKKEQAERLRIIAKRLDHTERAIRKEERPLLAHDYEQQQIDDRAAFEMAQKARLESAKLMHQQDLDTKKRLARVMDDYRECREVYISKRGEEYTKRREESLRRVEEEKAKRRKAVLKAREEEQHRLEEEERLEREREEEERRLEEECLAEEQRHAEEEEAVKATAEERKREEEEKKAEQGNARKKRRRPSSTDSARAPGDGEANRAGPLSQPLVGMLSERETMEMTKYTTRPPYIDAKAITELGLEVLALTIQSALRAHGNLPARSAGLRSSSGNPGDSSGELGFVCGLVRVFSPNTPAQADRVSDREQDALISRFHALSASDPDRVLRPGFGKRSAAIAIRANFFALKYSKDIVLYYYVVVIVPDVVSTAVRKRGLKLLEYAPETSKPDNKLSLSAASTQASSQGADTAMPYQEFNLVSHDTSRRALRRHEVRRAPPGGDCELDAARKAAGTDGKDDKKKKLQKKTRQVFKVREHVRQLCREERYPWVMEDANGAEIWEGNSAGGPSLVYESEGRSQALRC